MSDSLMMSEENMQLFMDAFYSELCRRQTKKRHYQFHEGNKIKKINSIRVEPCFVCNDENPKSETQQIVIVNYTNNDDILCSFNILLSRLKMFNLEADNIVKKQYPIKLPPI